VVSLAVLTVVAAATLSLLLFRDELVRVEDPTGSVEVPPPLYDDFEGEQLNAHWQPIAGQWGVQSGEAVVTAPAPARSLLVIPDAGADGVARVTASSVEDGWAFAFRVRDRDDYWSVIARPGADSWSIEHMDQGRSSELDDFLTVAPADGDQVEVRLAGATITVTINGDVSNSITDVALTDATGLGLLSVGGNPAALGWDDLEGDLTPPRTGP
jgi:hypothetical protein